jgi:hypothetical protein
VGVLADIIGINSVLDFGWSLVFVQAAAVKNNIEQ